MSGPGVSGVLLLLARSEESAREGRRLIGEAVSLRAAAYDVIPSGARVVFPAVGLAFVFERTVDGWVAVERHARHQGDPSEEWMREQWERGNLRLLDGSPE